jgi:FAD/FMN-containing dehydrogenase
MSGTKKQTLYGWGHTPVAECLSWRPEKQRELASILQQEGPKLARGMGRSYGDCSLQPEGVVLTERLNHFIEFDRKRGMVRAQAGVTLQELMELSIPRGWIPPVIPGTRHVTLGGAFACNVHGKNQYREGEFAEHVQSIKLLLSSGEIVDCSPTHNREIFWTTAGGMGMTGIIEEVTLKLKPIGSASLSSTTYRVGSLEEMVASFVEHRSSSDYMVGWIDHMARGAEVGRGIFEAASHIDETNGGKPLSSYKPDTAGINVPFFLPGFVLNRYSMAVYNKLRFRKYSQWRKTEITDFNNFFHPLDRSRNWNRLYGKRGFFQYQCMFPASPDVVQRMQTFLTALHSKNMFSFLAVIKAHRRSKGLLTFSQEGYSIALDFPNSSHVRAIMPQLNRWVADNGGRVYLAKDAVLSADLFRLMYGKNAQDWESVVDKLDAQAKFTSLMSQRLEWKRRE